VEDLVQQDHLEVQEVMVEQEDLELQIVLQQVQSLMPVEEEAEHLLGRQDQEDLVEVVQVELKLVDLQVQLL
jgi:hypothetical protein